MAIDARSKLDDTFYGITGSFLAEDLNIFSSAGKKVIHLRSAYIRDHVNIAAVTSSGIVLASSTDDFPSVYVLTLDGQNVLGNWKSHRGCLVPKEKPGPVDQIRYGQPSIRL